MGTSPPREIKSKSLKRVFVTLFFLRHINSSFCVAHFWRTAFILTLRSKSANDRAHKNRFASCKGGGNFIWSIL